ncbi:MAG TPA: hypothetical protein PLA94_15625 [Myxococcota bacterium]|nr:hypothetical protein [Myxococcota bacterium]
MFSRLLVPLSLVASLSCVGSSGGKKEEEEGDDSAADTAEDLPPAGDAVLLYIGNGGGAYDISAESLLALYEDAGVAAEISDKVPTDLADRYGTILLLSPTSGFPDAAPARELLQRGGTVLVAVEHGGYGDWAGATTWLGEIGSSMEALGGSTGGTVDLAITSVGSATKGVSSLLIFYYGDIDVGDGVALGTREDDEPGIGWEEVGAGQVILVPDGSMFGYSLDQADNRRFLKNLAP